MLRKMVACISILVLLSASASIDSYPDTQTYYNYISVDLVVLPATIEVGSTAGGFVYLVDSNGEITYAYYDVHVNISVDSADTISIDESTIVIESGNYYARFNIHAIRPGIATITAEHDGIMMKRTVQVVDTASVTTNRDITVSVEHPAGIMLTDSIMPLVVTLKDADGNPVYTAEDIRLRISHSSLIDVIYEDSVIRRGTSSLLMTIKSGADTGTAYISVSAEINGEEISASSSFKIVTLEPKRLRIITPPYVSKGYTPLDILVMLYDENDIPVPALHDVILNINTSSESTYWISDKSTRGQYVIKKGEYSLHIREYVFLNRTEDITVTVSAQGLISDSNKISVVEPLSLKDTKSKNRILRLYTPPSMLDGRSFALYQAYAVETDNDDCPEYIDAYSNGIYINIDPENIKNTCESEGYAVHPIDLLHDGELYPILSDIDYSNVLTSSSNRIVNIRGYAFTTGYGIVLLSMSDDHLNGDSNGHASVTVSLPGVGSVDGSITLVDYNKGKRSIVNIYSIEPSKSLMIITVVDDHGRPVIIKNMEYIINPLGIKVTIDEGSYTSVILPKHQGSIDVVALDMNEKLGVSSVLLDSDTYTTVKVKITPTLSSVPRGGSTEVFIQLFRADGNLYVADRDIRVIIADHDSESVAYIEKGRSSVSLKVDAIDDDRQLTVYLDNGAEDRTVIRTVQPRVPVLAMIHKERDKDELRIYTVKGAQVFYDRYGISTHRMAMDRDEYGYYAVLPIDYTALGRSVNVTVVYKGITSSISILPDEIPVMVDENGGMMNVSFAIPSEIIVDRIAYVEITVTDEHGTPVHGARVRVTGDDTIQVLNPSLYTDADGNARIFVKGSKSGNALLNVEVSREGFSTTNTGIDLTISEQIHSAGIPSAGDRTHDMSGSLIFMAPAVGGAAYLLTLFLRRRKSDTYEYEQE